MSFPRLHGTRSQAAYRTPEQKALIQRELDISYATVRTFAGIVGRKLYLKSGGVQATSNNSVITVPFHDPDLYLRVARQLSHILFETDPDARDAFLLVYVQRVAKFAQRGGVDIDGVLLGERLRALVNIIEAYRVTSLWGMLYPGNYLRLRLLDLAEAQTRLSQGQDQTLLGYFLLLSLGVEPEAPGLERYRPYMVEALKKVERRGFDATLLVSKCLDGSEGMSGGQGPEDPSEGAESDSKGKQDSEGKGKGEDAEGEQDGQEPWSAPDVKADLQTRTRALDDLIEKLGSLPEHIENRINSVEPDSFTPDWKRSKSRATAGSITNANVNEEGTMDALLGCSERDTRHQVDKTLTALANPPKVDRDEWLKKEARAKVEFVDVEKGAFECEPLDPMDVSSVKRMRAVFMRTLGRRKYALRDTGAETDIQAYIQRQVTNAPLDCFTHEERGMGFRALLLVDLSSSMSGPKAIQVERACRMLRRALDFPFCTVTVWGFSSPGGGRVNLHRFSVKDKDPPIKHFVNGCTPLHIAVKLAIRELWDSTEDRHLLVLTDGMPYFQSWKGYDYSTDQLQQYVAEAIKTGRSRGVHTTAMLVGDSHGGKVHYDISPKAMRKMFGPSKLWKRVGPETLGRDLVQMISSSFVNYLRQR